MGKLRDDTKKIAEQLTELSGRFGMASDPKMPPERAPDFAAMSQMAEASFTSMMSVSFAPARKDETSIPVAVAFVSPSDPNQPQAAQFTRMVESILRKNGVSAQKSPLPNPVTGRDTDRTLRFTATAGNAENLATALTEINQFLEADKAQEAAVRELLTKASRIENQYSDGPTFSNATKVSPTFEIQKVRDVSSGAVVNEPVFGVTIQTSDYPLMDGLTGASTDNPGIQRQEKIFERIDIGARQFKGIEITAQGTALKDVMEVAGKDRADLVKEQDNMSRAPDAGKKKPEDLKKKGDSWGDMDLGGGNSIAFPPGGGGR